jgi:hypothetical protein
MRLLTRVLHTAARVKHLPIFVLAVGLFTLLSAVTPASQPTVNEREVKAAMLYRVAKFIDWPEHAFANSGAPFVICVAGDETVLRAFEALNGRALNGRNVTVRRVSGDAFDLRQCHAAYFPRDAVGDSDYAIGKLQGSPVLTVGEAEDFAYRGGILALVTRDAKVQFAFNLPASRQAGLKVSAQLLQLATVVGGP